MNITELKQKIESGEKLRDLIEIKPYLPFIAKKMLIESIIEGCIQVDQNGINTCDYFMKKLLLDIKLIVEYTNIEFGENEIEEYDELVKNKVMFHVWTYINQDELIFINDLLDDELHQKLEIGNSIGNIVAQGIQKLIDKIPNNNQLSKLIKTASKELQKFDPNKLNQIQQMIKTVK